jgi:putative RNA 2'-phosphotransferase
MDQRRLVKVSKYLSRHLRHDPGRLGLTLDSGGWVAVEELLSACAAHHFPLTRDELDEVVARNDKRRFSFDPTRTRLRANQGHTVPVDLELAPSAPPPTLYHGTHESAVPAIRREGVRPMERHHVHLSTTVDAARRVGARRGRPVVLAVDAGRMAAQGVPFYVTDNGVWLTDAVPPEFLEDVVERG